MGRMHSAQWTKFFFNHSINPTNYPADQLSLHYLIRENLVSTRLNGEDNYKNSMMSKGSSHLFREDLFDTQNAWAYCPPPSHLLPSKMPKKELMFLSNNQDTKLSNVNDAFTGEADISKELA